MNTQNILVLTDIAFRVIGILAIITGTLAFLNRFYVMYRTQKRRKKSFLREQLDEVDLRICRLEDQLEIVREQISYLQIERFPPSKKKK